MSPVFIVNLEMLMFVQKLKEHHWIEWRAVIFSPKQFSAGFVWKKVFVSDFYFETFLTIPTAHIASHIWRSFSTNAFLAPLAFCLAALARSQLNVAQTFGGQKFFRWRAYGKNIWKLMSFGGQVSLCCSYLAYYPVCGFPISATGIILHF